MQFIDTNGSPEPFYLVGGQKEKDGGDFLGS